MPPILSWTYLYMSLNTVTRLTLPENLYGSRLTVSISVWKEKLNSKDCSQSRITIPLESKILWQRRSTSIISRIHYVCSFTGIYTKVCVYLGTINIFIQWIANVCRCLIHIKTTIYETIQKGNVSKTRYAYTP
jgi:hypothetical protein